MPDHAPSTTHATPMLADTGRAKLARFYLQWVRPIVSGIAGLALVAIWLAYPTEGIFRAAVVAIISSLVALAMLAVARTVGYGTGIRVSIYVDIILISVFVTQFDSVDVFGVTFLWAVVVAAAFATPRDMVVTTATCVGLALVLPYATRDPDGAQVLVEALMLGVVGMMVTALGIDETRVVRERRALEQQLRDAQRLAKLGSFDYEPATDTATWSEELHRILQVPEGRGLGQDAFLDVVVESDRQAVATAMRGGLERGEDVVFDTTVRRGDGELRRVHVLGTPVVGDGGVLRVIGTVQDVTDLRRLDEMRDEFVAAASHELRTPTSIVLGFATTLTQQWDRLADDDRRRFVGQIEDAAIRLSMLIEDVLQVTQIESGNVKVLRERFDLLAEATDLAGAWPGTSEIVVEGDGIDDAAAIGDVTRTRQVLMNLLENAERHGATADTGIRLQVDRVDGCVVARVIDEGPGIPADAQERIFDRFVRLGQDSTGTGLGLYISRRLAEAQGGRLDVESEPGRGTTFTFALPADGGRVEA